MRKLRPTSIAITTKINITAQLVTSVLVIGTPINSPRRSADNAICIPESPCVLTESTEGSAVDSDIGECSVALLDINKISTYFNARGARIVA